MWLLLTRFHSFCFLTAVSALATLLIIHRTCYLTLARLRYIGQPLCVDACVGGNVRACASLCTKGWSGDIRELVLYDVWHDMRRLTWHEIDCLAVKGEKHNEGPIFLNHSRVSQGSHTAWKCRKIFRQFSIHGTREKWKKKYNVMGNYFSILLVL